MTGRALSWAERQAINDEINRDTRRPLPYKVAPQEFQLEECEEVLRNLRGSRTTTLYLRYNAAEYMFRPSGQLRGRELEDALSQSPSVTSLWLHATAESDAEFARLSQTLALSKAAAWRLTSTSRTAATIRRSCLHCAPSLPSSPALTCDVQTRTI